MLFRVTFRKVVTHVEAEYECEVDTDTKQSAMQIVRACGGWYNARKTRDITDDDEHLKMGDAQEIVAPVLRMDLSRPSAAILRDLLVRFGIVNQFRWELGAHDTFGVVYGLGNRVLATLVHVPSVRKAG